MAKAMNIKVGNPLRKLVLIKLADNANDQGECWPSVPYIAEQCEISERSVQNHIQKLVKNGLVRIEERKSENGLNRSNVYHLRLNSAGANAAPYGESHAPSGVNGAPVIGTQQERRLRRPLRRLFEVIHYSEFSSPLPDGFSFDFNPLWQMSEPDRATVAEKTVNTINAAMDSGLLTLQGGMTELRDKAGIIGIGSSISDEDIESAKDIDPPNLGESADLNPPEITTRGNPISNAATQDSAHGRRHRKWYLRWF